MRRKGGEMNETERTGEEIEEDEGRGKIWKGGTCNETTRGRKKYTEKLQLIY